MATVCVDMRVVSVVMTAQTFDPSRGYYHDNGENHHIQLVKMVLYIMHFVMYLALSSASQTLGLTICTVKRKQCRKLMENIYIFTI